MSIEISTNDIYLFLHSFKNFDFYESYISLFVYKSQLQLNINDNDNEGHKPK